MREAMRLAPNSWIAYVNLAANLNRLEEAEEVYKQADQHNIASETFYRDRYALAFLKGDTAQMAQRGKCIVTCLIWVASGCFA